MFWGEKEAEIPATWQEVSTFYKAWLKSVFFSEFNRVARPICYAKTVQEKQEVPGPGLDFAPLIFQNIFYVDTKKGFDFKRSLNSSSINSKRQTIFETASNSAYFVIVLSVTEKLIYIIHQEFMNIY